MSVLTKKLQKFRDISVKLCLSERCGEAVKMCDTALEMLDGSPEMSTPEGPAWKVSLMATKASALMAQKDADGALKCYEKALEIQASLPKSPALAYLLDSMSKAYEARGDSANASACRVAALEALEEASPESRPLVAAKYMEAADALEASGRAAEAVELRRRARALDPDAGKK